MLYGDGEGDGGEKEREEWTETGNVASSMYLRLFLHIRPASYSSFRKQQLCNTYPSITEVDSQVFLSLLGP